MRLQFLQLARQAEDEGDESGESLAHSSRAQAGVFFGVGAGQVRLLRLGPLGFLGAPDW